MITDTIRTIAPHLQDHAIAKFPNERNMDCTKELLSISDTDVRGLGIDPRVFCNIPDSLYYDCEPISVSQSGETERYHVFLRSGVDRLLGPGWQAGRGR